MKNEIEKIFDVEGLTPREKILIVQDKIEKEPNAVFGDNVHCPLKHSFADGIYVREIFIPKGFLGVGKIHKHEHPNFLMSGEVSVYTESGGVQRLVGPVSMISPAGTKRVVYAHTDVVWITVHHNPTNTQDLMLLEDFIISKDYAGLILTEEQVVLLKGESNAIA